MGLMRFLVPPPSQISETAARQVYISGTDQIPWRSDIRRQGDQLIIQRSVSDSGNVHVPWEVEGFGELVLSTGTLMERHAAYLLPVELARGKVNQVRNQLADWQTIGLLVSDDVKARLHVAIEHFALAATTQHEPAAAVTHSQAAIRAAVEAGDRLVSCYVEQALEVRHRQTPRLPTWLAANIGHTKLDATAADRFLAAFNTAVLPLVWRDIEAEEGRYDWDFYDASAQWCSQQGCRVIGGPLVRLDDRGLPDWLCLWEGDFDNLVSCVKDYVETAVNRYRGQVSLWQSAARVNTGKVLALSEEEKLRLAVSSIEITRGADPDTPAIIRFDQPWAEYMSHEELDLSPLHFADALVRADLGLAGIGLEINMGYHPRGSWLRDRLDMNRLLDLWSCLGLPLLLSVTFPTSGAADSLAWGQCAAVADGPAGGWTPASQRAFVEHYVPLMFSKPAVQAVIWSQYRDADRHEFPFGGLIEADGSAKPALAALTELRRRHLE
jgi:hypothetical protein